MTNILKRFSNRFKKYSRRLSDPFGKYQKNMKTRNFGSPSTRYQAQVNTGGRLGPASSAFWNNTLSLKGPAYSMAAQPLYYAPSKGVYVTSADVPAAMGSVNFSNFGFGRKRSRRGSRKRKNKTSKRRNKTSKRKSRKSKNFFFR
jgi:hypothetical protein